MQFRTKIPVPRADQPIDYASRVVSLGSCFAVNIGEKFEYFKFQSSTNPFGIIFNAVSIEKLLRRIAARTHFTEKDIFHSRGRWYSFEMHSELSSGDKKAFLEQLNEILEETHTQISHATHIIITLGTSWVYREKQRNEIVANCHKLPQKQFDKELLSVETNKEAISGIIEAIRRLNPKVALLFTVSPVRHIKDGFVENQWSKANLIAALQEVFSEAVCGSYFPSYEIMMDELRDYRFYAQDMLHPNQTAVDYIWDVFSEAYMDKQTFSVMKEIEDIQKALNHRPFTTEGEEYAKFLSNLQEKIKKMEQRFPHMKF